MRVLGDQEFSEGSKLVNVAFNSGPTFPTEASNGEVFVIDDPNNLIQDGLYWYSSKRSMWILLVAMPDLDQVVSPIVADQVANAPPKFNAQTEEGTTTASTLVFSSTIRGSVREEGQIALEYVPPMIELSMASAIDINTTSVVAIPFNQVIELASEYTFTTGSSRIYINQRGLYDITYNVCSQRISGQSTGNMRTFIRRNGNYSYAKSSVYSMIEQTNADKATNQGNNTVTLDVGDYIELCSERTARNAVTRLLTEQTNLTVKLLKELT